MTEALHLSTSEAIQLGRCLRHFNMARRDDPGAYLLYFLRRYVPQTRPDTPCLKPIQIDIEGLPTDVEWRTLGLQATEFDDVRFGLSRSQPESVYGERSGRLFRQHRVEVEGGLLDQLVEAAGDDLCRKSTQDFLEFPPSGCPHWGISLLFRLAELKASSASLPCHEGNDSAAERSLRSLLESCDHRVKTSFNVGERLGEVEYYADCLLTSQVLSCACHEDPEYNQLIGFMEEETGLSDTWRPTSFRVAQREGFGSGADSGSFPTTAVFLNELNSAIQRVLDDDEVPAWTQLHMLSQVDCLLFSPSAPVRWLDAMGVIMKIRTGVSHLVGELRGANLKENEDMPRPVRVPKQMRTISIGVNATPESVWAYVRDCDECFLSNRYPRAEQVIVLLVNGIEVLTKRLWPDEQRGADGRYPVKEVLTRKIRQGSDSEKKFARYAFTLYTEYRNRVDHEMDTLKCSYQEAYTFLQVMKFLNDLYSNIIDGK